MDSYDPYLCPSDFGASSNQRAESVVEESKRSYTQTHPHQRLPPFRELLAGDIQPATELPSADCSTATIPSTASTSRTFQSSSTPQKVEPSSPDQLHSIAGVDTLDNMASMSGDSTYMTQRYQRQNPSWNSSSPYSDFVGSYSGQPRNPYAIQTQYTIPKANPSLPSIRDLTTYSQPFPSNTTQYAYGSSGGSYHGGDNYSMKTEPTYPVKSEYPIKTEGHHEYYSSAPRCGQGYSMGNRPSASHMDYQPRSYGWPVGYPAPTAYGDTYLQSPTGGHPSISPTVSSGGDCLGNNRRRRGNLPKDITEYLKRWFMEHIDTPYPSEDDKLEFVRVTNLTIAQISNWFINARRRHLQTWREAARAQNRAAHVEYEDSLGRPNHKQHRM